MSTKSARVILKISQAAKLLNVSKDTLRRWEKAGKLKSQRSASGYRLYDVTDLVDQISSQKLRNQIIKNYPELEKTEERVSDTADKLLKIGEAATLLHVSKDTLRRWEQVGKIDSIRTQAGYRLYDVSKLLDIKQRKNSKLSIKIPRNTSLSIQSAPSTENVITESYQPKASDYIPVNIDNPENVQSPIDTMKPASTLPFSSLVEQTSDYLTLQTKPSDFHTEEISVLKSEIPDSLPNFSSEAKTSSLPELSVPSMSYHYASSILADDVSAEGGIRASDLVPPQLEISIIKQQKEYSPNFNSPLPQEDLYSSPPLKSNIFTPNRILSRGNPAFSIFGAFAAIVIWVLILNISYYINPFNTTSTNSNKPSLLSVVLNSHSSPDKSSGKRELEGSQVLAESTIAEIGRFLEVNSDLVLTGNLAVEGQAIFGEEITAPNILYGIVAGANVTISGDAQNPVISTIPTTETDTLATVTSRGGVTSTPVSFLGGATVGSILTIGQLSSDPSTASNGGIYYNTTSNKYRCYINGSWSDCDTNTASSGDITGVSTGDGLTGGVSSGDANLSVLLVTLGTSTTTSSNSGLELSTSGLGLLRGCSGGELLKWNSTTEVWECSTDAAGTNESNVQEGGVTLSSSIDTYNFDATDFDVSVTGSTATMSIDYTNSHITRDDQTQSISGAWTFSDLTVLDTNVAFTGATSTLTATGALTFTTSDTFTVNTNNFSQIYTSGVVTGTTTSSGFVLSAPSLTTGTALYLTSSATSGKLLDLNATQTSGSIFSLAYGASRTLSGDLTGLYLNLESGGNLDITNQNFTGTNIVVPAVTDTHTSGMKSIRGLLVNFGAGAGINQNGAGGTLEYIGGDFQLPALTQTAGTLNAYGVRLTTPTSITTGGTAYAFYVNPNGVAAGTLSAFGVGSITGGSGAEDAITIGTGWDSILKVGSNTIINGSGITQPVGGGTGLSTYATGDLIYASSASTFARRAIGNDSEVLAVVGGVPTWTTISGSSCTNCLVNNPTATQTISPTNDSTGLSVRQTTAGSPTADIFNITDSTGSTKYFYVDAFGNVSSGSISNTTITLTPTGNQTALTLVGTNVTSAKNQYINTSNDSGTIFDLSYGAANTLTGTLTAHNVDLSTNVTATNQSVSGYVVTLPGATNTATSGTTYYKGINISGGSLNQNGAGGTTYFIGADITMPAITQTAGGMTAIGTRITTPTSVTTGGGASGLSIAASGIGAGNLYGINIGSITGGAGSETGLLIGDGWDTSLYFNDNSANIRIPDSGTLTFMDGSGNTLCSMTDAGTTGNFSCTGINGYWSKSGTTLSPATANDTVTIATTNTTGADFAITNTGAYTGTGLIAVSANSATTGDLLHIGGTSLTSGSALVIDGRNNSGQIDDFIKITSDVGGGSGSPSLLKLTPDFSPTTASSVHGILMNATDSTTFANSVYGYAVNLTLTNDAGKNGYGVYSSVTSNSTTIDNLNGHYSAITQSGALSSGFRRTNAYYAAGSMTGASSGGQSELVNYFSSTTVTGGTSSANVAAIDFYALGGTVTATSASNLVTRYGYYAANATMNTTGSTTQYGTYISALSGADNNYGVFIGNASGGTAAASLTIGGVNTSGTYSIYSDTSNTSYFAGSIGIGTTTPQSSFVHILGGNDAFSTNQLHLSSGSGTNAEYAFFGANAASDYLRIGYYNGSSFGNVKFEGNVGIGDASPSRKLSVRGDGGAVGSNLGTMSLTTVSDTNRALEIGRDYTNNIGFIQAVTHGTGYVPFVLQYNGGNVGIGALTAPETKLDVVGGLQLRTSAEYNSSNTASGSRIVSTPNLHLDSGEGATALYLNYFGGTGGVNFCNGGQGCSASISAAGGLTTTSVSSSGGVSGTTGTFSSALSATSGSFSSSVVASTAINGNWAGQFINTDASGYGAYIRGGGAGSYALIVADYSAGTNLFLIHGNGSIGATGTYSSAAGSVQVTTGELYDFNTTGTNNAATACFDSGGFIGRCSSDGKMKTNIAYMGNGALETVMALKPANFDFITGGDRKGGFIAQDLDDLIPEAVTMNDDGFYSFNSDAVLAVLTKGVQELNQKVDNALLTIGEDGYASNQVTVQKIKVIEDAEIAGSVIASDFSLDVTKFNRTGTLASVPETETGTVSVADAINTLNDGLSNLAVENASQSAQIAQAKVLGEKAVEHALTLDEKVASTSSTLSSLQSKIDELLSGFGDTEPTPSSDDLVNPETTMIATDSAELNTILVRSEATVSGTLQAYNGIFQNSLKSLGETLLGNTTIAGDVSVNGTLTISEGNKVDAVGTLFFQSNPLADLIDMFNGAVIIAGNGNITTSGEVKAATVTADKLQINEDESNSSVGSAVIPAGEVEVPIFTNKVTENSKVFIALTSSTKQTVIVAEKIDGAGFVVTIENPETKDTSFDWFIVN